jgi:prepilin-type N-terminal cleavage/methylation domain-containing protein
VPKRLVSGPDPARGPRAFTLIELMLAVLLLALLASAAALSFSQPIRAARLHDAIEQLRAFDATARQAAVSSGHSVRLAFDLGAGTLARRDEGGRTLRFQSTLPPGFRVDELRIGGHTASSGQALLDISPLGASRTYALHLRGPSTDQWLLIAGMSGQMAIISNELALDTIFAQIAPPASPRHDAD